MKNKLMHCSGGRLSFLTLFVLIAADVSAQLSPRTAAVIDSTVVQQMKQQKAVGMAIGIVKDGELVYLKAYGF